MAQRKRLLPIASSGAPPIASIDAALWSSLEMVIERDLTPAIRSEMLDATNHFLEFAIFEHTAGPFDGAVNRLSKLSRAAMQFQRELIEGGGGDGAFFADHHIELNFFDARFDKKDSLHHLTGIMASFLVACDLAKKALASEDIGEHCVGDAWNGWIRRLTQICKRNGLPSSVRKDSDKNKHSESPKFVQIVKLLQTGFQPDYRRGEHSATALTTAISRARSGHKKRKQASE